MERSWNRWCFSGAESGISTMGSLGWAMRTPGMALRPPTSRAQACLRGRCISGEAKYRAKLRASRPGRRLLAHRKLPLRSAALSTLDVVRLAVPAAAAAAAAEQTTKSNIPFSGISRRCAAQWTSLLHQSNPTIAISTSTASFAWRYPSLRHDLSVYSRLEHFDLRLR
jgi:hypothetical protein